MTLTVTEAIRARRSTRAFLPTQVPKALLRDILETARLAPSNSNMQPWLVHVVTGDTLARLKAATAAEEARRFACGERQYGARGIAREDGEGRLRYVYNNHQCFGAPAVMFFFAEPGEGLS